MSNGDNVKLIDSIKVVLGEMGVDLNSPDFKDTPKRFAKAMLHFSIEKEEPKITTFDHITHNNLMVEVDGLEVRSLCGHHLFPFMGTAKISYIPNGKKAGLSKFQRALDYVANKPQDQEKLTEELLDFLVDKISPKYMSVELNCTHTCMTVRGVKCHSATTKTVATYEAL